MQPWVIIAQVTVVLSADVLMIDVLKLIKQIFYHLLLQFVAIMLFPSDLAVFVVVAKLHFFVYENFVCLKSSFDSCLVINNGTDVFKHLNASSQVGSVVRLEAVCGLIRGILLRLASHVVEDLIIVEIHSYG